MVAVYEVIVLAGGRSTRYGSDKLVITLDRVLDGMPSEARVVCVGDQRPTNRGDVLWVREDPAFGGPLLAVAQGFALCTAPVAVVVGGDMPSVGAAVPALVEAVISGGRPVALVDAEGRLQPLASAWPLPVLRELLEGLGSLEGRPLRLLLSAAAGGVEGLPDRWNASRDIDVPSDG